MLHTYPGPTTSRLVSICAEHKCGERDKVRSRLPRPVNTFAAHLGAPSTAPTPAFGVQMERSSNEMESPLNPSWYDLFAALIRSCSHPRVGKQCRRLRRASRPQTIRILCLCRYTGETGVHLSAGIFA